MISDRVPSQCNGIVADGYNTSDGHFVARMNFTANHRYNDRTVQCHINHGTRQPPTLIGNTTVKTTPGKD